MTIAELPPGLVHVRTTADFDAESVPAGLLRTHRVADGVWGRLVARAGAVTLVFEDDPREVVAVTSPNSTVIPPGRPHHVELGAGAVFAVEFHRPPDR